MLERRRPRDGFEIPNIPGGWIDYYTERQFNLEDVVQFQHLARPSTITCAKQAIGQAKRRCIQIAASACQAPIYLYTIAQNTQANLTSAMQVGHNFPTVNQIVRRVRRDQAAERRRTASPRQSPHQSPRQSPRRSPRHAGADRDATTPSLTPNSTSQVVLLVQSSNPVSMPINMSQSTVPADTIISPQTPRRETISSWIPSNVTASTSTAGHFSATKLPKPAPRYFDCNDSFDSPAASDWLNVSGEVSYVDLYKPPQSPISPRTAAEHQLIAELEEAASSSSEAPSTPTEDEFPLMTVDPAENTMDVPAHASPQDATEFSSFCPFSPEVTEVSTHNTGIPTTPQPLSKPHPSYMGGHDSDFSSHVPFSPDVTNVSAHVTADPRDATEFSSNVPFSPEVTIVSAHVNATPKDTTEFSSFCPFSPDVTNVSTQATATPKDATEFSSNVPFSPDVTEVSTHVAVHADGETEDFLPPLADSTTHPIHIPVDARIEAEEFLGELADLSTYTPIHACVKAEAISQNLAQPPNYTPLNAHVEAEDISPNLANFATHSPVRALDEPEDISRHVADLSTHAHQSR
jgi:hypothetical protein